MSNTFCSLPWNHLATHPNGNVSLCCQSVMANGLSMAKGEDGSFLTLDNDSIENIQNSPTFNNVRLKMLNNEEPPECENCYLRERNGNISKRQYEKGSTSFTIDDAIKNTAPDGSTSVGYEFIELRLGNTCNLKCLTCNPNSSYLLHKEFTSIKSKEGFDFVTDYSWVSKGTYEWVENPDFWSILKSRSQNLKRIYINGGEPTLIKAHYKYLEELIKNGTASHIELIYSINMTNIPQRCFDIWKQFKKVQIEASIDDLDERNTYIRFPSKWDKILSGLAELELNNIHFQVLQTVSAINFYHLDEFYNFFQDNYPGVAVVHNYVFSPDYYSPLVLPKSLRADILKRLESSLPNKLMHELNGMYLDKEDNKLFPQFKSVLFEFDKLRSNSFKDSFKEYSSYLKIVDSEF